MDADNPDKEIIHRGKYKRLSTKQKGWLRRRPAIEPAIGHLKSDHRMDRCWLQGALGDALHSISCAAGYNLRWLLRAIARRGIGAVFLRLLQAALSPPWTKGTLQRSHACVGTWCLSNGAGAVEKPNFGQTAWAGF